MNLCYVRENTRMNERKKHVFKDHSYNDPALCLSYQTCFSLPADSSLTRTFKKHVEDISLCFYLCNIHSNLFQFMMSL